MMKRYAKLYNVYVDQRILKAGIGFAVLYLILAAEKAAYSEIDQVDVTLTVSTMFSVEYTGDNQVTFTIDAEDLEEGSTQEDGNTEESLLWMATAAPWEIRVNRTEWNGPSSDIILQIKYGPPPPPPGDEQDNFNTVPVANNYLIFYTSDNAFEVEGHDTGEGEIQGIDWKVKNLGWDTPQGTYTCVVTFWIEPI